MISVAAGLIKGLNLKSPEGDQTRPSSERLRQGIFNVLRFYRWGESTLFEGATVADVFGGSGAWGIEALSNGATEVSFLENHPLALKCLKQNVSLALKSLRAQGVEPKLGLVAENVESGYAKLPLCRVVFADPPYRKNWFEKLLALEARSPRVEKGGVFLFEAQAKEISWSEEQKALVEKANLKLFNEKNYGDSTVYFFVKE